MLPGQLVHPSFHESPDVVPCYETIPAYDLADEYNLALNRRMLKFTDNRIPSGDTAVTALFGVTGFAYNKDSGFSIAPLLMTMPERSWQLTRKLVLDSVAPVFDAQQGDLKQHSYPTALQLTRPVHGKEQRIIVTGDADFVSPLRVAARQAQVRAIFSWLHYNRYPEYTLFPFPEDNWLTVTPSWVKLERLISCMDRSVSFIVAGHHTTGKTKKKINQIKIKRTCD